MPIKKEWDLCHETLKDVLLSQSKKDNILTKEEKNKAINMPSNNSGVFEETPKIKRKKRS